MSISPRSGVGGLQRSVHLKSYNAQKWKSPLAPLLVETDICVADFFVQNSIPNNFYLKLFFMQCVFLAALSPKVNLISHFCTL